MLRDDLPEQFLMHYNYDFLFRMKSVLIRMRARAKHGKSMIAHSVMEEMIFYLSSEETTVLMELSADKGGFADEISDYSSDWVFDLFDDMDIVTCLYSDMYIDPEHIYHFTHWFDYQFYIDAKAD